MRELPLQKGKGSTPAESHRCHQLARPSCGGESPMVTRRLRLLVSSASVGIRYIGMFRSKNVGLESLENELYAGNRRRETMSESEMQAELERLRAENAQLKSKRQGRSQFEGERERRGLPVRHVPLSGHALQRAMAPHP